MGGFANTFNTPTGIQTQVSGASAPGYGGYGANPYGDMSWLVNLAKRRAQQKIKAGDIQNAGAALQLKMAEDARTAHPSLDEQNTRHAQAYAAQEQANAAAAQARAQYERQPMRFSFGPGWSAWTPDVNAMTGAQRQAYLPQGNSMTGPSFSEQDQVRRNNSIEDMARMQNDAYGRTVNGIPSVYGLSLAQEQQAPGIGNAMQQQNWARMYGGGGFQEPQQQQQQRKNTRVNLGGPNIGQPISG